jgi:hypothetical protein
MGKQLHLYDDGETDEELTPRVEPEVIRTHPSSTWRLRGPSLAKPVPEGEDVPVYRRLKACERCKGKGTLPGVYSADDLESYGIEREEAERIARIRSCCPDCHGVGGTRVRIA